MINETILWHSPGEYKPKASSEELLVKYIRDGYYTVTVASFCPPNHWVEAMGDEAPIYGVLWWAYMPTGPSNISPSIPS